MTATRKLTPFLRPYWKPAAVAPLLMLIEVVADLLLPRLMQHIVDEAIPQHDLLLLVHTGLIMVAAALIGTIGGAGNTVAAVRVAQGLGADIRDTLYRKVQSLSFGNLDRLGTGELVTRLTSDVTQVQELVLVVLRIMVRAPLLLVGSLVMAVMTSPRLALLLLVLGPVVMAFIVWMIRRARPMFTQVQERLDTLNAVIQENLAGVRVVKAFVRADHEKARFGTANNDLMDQTIRVARLFAVGMPFMMVTMNLGVICTLWFGGVGVARGDMQAGQIIAFINYLLMVLLSLMMVSMLLMRLARAEASAERILEVLDSRPEVTDRPNAVTSFSPRGRVAFEHVSFHYAGAAGDPVLRDVSFVAEPGQKVAVLGATGSGKSSLINLIPRFYDVTAGRVTIDGTDIRDLSQNALRRAIGVTLQEALLFTGTVRDNIRYGRPDAADEEVISAAKAAQAHEFITVFPNGYDTVLGQRGVNLSGGQKQRVAIARALLVNPAVLILVDSTSAVDVETEAVIQDALAQRMAGATGFVVAQRISTVLTMDKILVLEDGVVAAEGTHKELMASSPIYREIYESQLGNGAERA